jgi:spore maturation protein CgeB
MAANPKIYKPLDLPFTYDVTFVGQRYADRGELIIKLIRAGILVKVFGPKWQKQTDRLGTYKIIDRLGKIQTISKQQGIGKTISFLAGEPHRYLKTIKEDSILSKYVGPILEDDEMIRVFNQTKINLGFSTVFDAGRDESQKKYHIRLRDFEVPMCGAFYLSFYTEELEEYFIIGKEIDCYNNKEELISKTSFYLKNENVREKIRKQGYQRSLNSHTWEKRFDQLFHNEIFCSIVQ